MNYRLPCLLALSCLLAAPLAWAGKLDRHLNQPLPAFSVPASDGQNMSLSDYKGQVVMLNFWASWCGPCREEMPLLQGLHDKYKRLGFSVVGINVDKRPKDAQSLLKESHVTFPVGYDSRNQVSAQFDIDAMPSTLMIDRQGKLRYIHRGYKPGYEQDYEQQIRTLLRER